MKNRLIAFLLGLALSASVAVFGASVGGNTGGVQYVQGYTGMTPITTTPSGSGTANVNLSQVGGNAVNTGLGASGTGTPRVAISSDSSIAFTTNSLAGADAKSNTVTNIGNVFNYPSVYNGATWDRLYGTTAGTFVQGNVAHDAPASANPLLMGASAFNGTQTAVSADGDAVKLAATRTGKLQVAPATALTGADALANNYGVMLMSNDGGASPLGAMGWLYNTSTWDRARSAGAGNNVASTGIAAAAPYGQYLGNATQPALTTGNYGAAQLDPAGNLRTAPQRPTATDILSASASVTATTASTALITISAGRTWVGQVCVSVQGSKAAAATGNGEVLGTILTAGTSVTPAAGTYYEIDTAMGANAATGVVGTQGSNLGCTAFTEVAPAGNTVTLNYSATCTSTTACRVSVSANGVMQ